MLSQNIKPDRLLSSTLFIIHCLINLFIINNCVNNQQVEVSTRSDDAIIKINIPDLPPKHYQFWLKNNPRALKEYQEICRHKNNFAIEENFQNLHANLTFDNELYLTDLDYGKSVLNVICSNIKEAPKSCWGYENNCQIIHAMPECLGAPKSSLGQAKSEQEQKITWFSQADFGYILDRRKEMARYCSPDKYSNDTIKSSLECTRYFRTCRANNLFIKFNKFFEQKSESLITINGNNNDNINNVVSKVGGWNCDLQLKRIQEETGQNGILQSWFNELKNYNLIQNEPPPTSGGCDITIDKQVFLLKLDSPFNMYHYFCNFLNLYATFHLNNRFSYDNQIIIWDYQLPKGKFELMWKVFSKNKLISIGDFENKRVCFKKAIFTLLPRMVDGLYYSTPLIPGCSKSGLFDAFNKHIIHKLNIKQDYNLIEHKRTNNKLIRVTSISRSTLHRRVINEKDIELAVMSDNNYDYKFESLDYAKLDFKEQLTKTQNTDILIGIHGAGLTNSLFLPDWAALIELNDCNDKSYYDLARLRGINYFAPRNEAGVNMTEKVPVDDKIELEKLTQSNLVEHEKFSNYRVNVERFTKLLSKATERVVKNRIKYFNNMKEMEHKKSQQLEEKKKNLKAEIKKESHTKHIEL